MNTQPFIKWFADTTIEDIPIVGLVYQTSYRRSQPTGNRRAGCPSLPAELRKWICRILLTRERPLAKQQALRAW